MFLSENIEKIVKVDNSLPIGNGSIDRTGLKYNRLTGVSYYGYQLLKSGKRKTLWVFKCECGKEITTRSSDVASGRIASCGCLNSENIKAYNIRTKTKDFYDGFSAVWQSYKCGARKRSLCFELSKEEFRTITAMNCHYCDQEPSNKRAPRVKTKKQSFIFNGIDRVDSSVGYTTENSVPCCSMCNLMKRDFNLDDWLDKLKRIIKHTEKVRK